MKPILYEGVLWGMPIVFKAYQTFNLLALAVVCAYGTWALRRHQVNWPKIIGLGVLMTLAFLVGARLYYALLHLPAMVAEPSKLWQLSLINFGLYGGLSGSLLALWLWCRREGLELWPRLDQGVPWLAVALGLSKLGCLMNGCCYGVVTEGPFGVYFPRAQGAFGSWLGPGLIGQIFGGSLQLRHPEQLYEVLVFLLAALLVMVGQKRVYSRKEAKLKTGTKANGITPVLEPVLESVSEKASELVLAPGLARVPGLAALTYLGLITLGRLALYPLRDYPESSSLTEMLRGPATYGIVLMGLLAVAWLRVVASRSASPAKRRRSIG